MAQLGVTLYLPVTPDIVDAFGMSDAEGYTALLIYLGGTAVPLVFAVQLIRFFGRSVVLLGFCGVFFSGSILSIWVHDNDGFIFPGCSKALAVVSPTAHREAETAKAHRG